MSSQRFQISRERGGVEKDFENMVFHRASKLQWNLRFVYGLRLWAEIKQNYLKIGGDSFLSLFAETEKQIAQMSSYLRRPEVIENLTVSRSRPGITFCMCWEYYAPTAFSFGGTQNINTNSAYNVTQKPLLQRFTRNIKKDRFVYVVCTCLSSRFRFFNKGQLLVANRIVPWREEYLYAKPYCESPQRSLVTCTVVERFLNMVCRNLTPRYSRLKYISWTFLNETNHIKHSLVMYWRTFLSMYQELFRVDSLKAPEALTLTKQNNSILPSKRPCW